MDLRKNEKVLIEGSIITISSFYAFGKFVSEKEFDLSLPEYDRYRGGILRIWVDYNLTTNRNSSQLWLLAEIPLPRRVFETIDTGEVDDDGNPITEQQEIPLVINEADCNIYPLPPSK